MHKAALAALSVPWRVDLAKTLDKRRRSGYGAGFVMLPRFMLKSPAWLSLSAPARAIYVEMECRYYGTNNGDIGLSVREASKLCRIAKDTAGKAIQELQDKGFIRCRRKGAFHRKIRHASEWELTAQPFDTGEPTKDFMSWQPCEKKKSRS